jgi:UDP-glucose 4-epimerase
MKLSGKNVLVTGGAGFIGSHLVDRIIQENPAKLLVVDNFFLGQEENLHDARENYPGLKVNRLDASDLDSMRNLVEAEKVEVVFNLAVIPLPTSLHYPVWTIHTNVGIATTFCELVRWGSIQTLVHVSSSEAYGSALYIPMDEKHPMLPTTPYAASKTAEDQIVLSYHRTFHIDTVIARPFNNFGPRQNMGSYAGIIPIIVQRVTKGLPIEIYGDGEQTRDFIFVRDTVRAFVRVYEEEATRGLELNIATGHEININDLVHRLLCIMRVPNYPVIHTDPRPGDVRRHCGDVTLAGKLIGYESRPLTDDQLEETVSWYLRRTG